MHMMGVFIFKKKIAGDQTKKIKTGKNPLQNSEQRFPCESSQLIAPDINFS
jgi:hypothetical protein